MQKHLESCTRKVPMTTDTPSASPVRASGNNADAPTSVANANITSPSRLNNPHLGRLRHRPRQRVALPLHRRRIRRRGLHPDVSHLPRHFGPARHGHGVRRRPRLPAFGRPSLRYPAALAALALVLLVGLHRLHAAHDVLHHGLRLDARLHGENGHGHLRRP